MIEILLTGFAVVALFVLSFCVGMSWATTQDKLERLRRAREALQSAKPGTIPAEDPYQYWAARLVFSNPGKPIILSPTDCEEITTLLKAKGKA